jgi:MYXO-CTERM domain-containing protein
MLGLAFALTTPAFADGEDHDNDGYSVEEGDCDDQDATVHPNADEGCDGLDTDCDGVIPAEELDGDGDGVSLCAGDCDDAVATTFPGAPELCNGVDDDCDLTVDEDCATVTTAGGSGASTDPTSSTSGGGTGAAPGTTGTTGTTGPSGTDPVTDSGPTGTDPDTISTIGDRGGSAALEEKLVAGGCGCNGAPTPPTGVLAALVALIAAGRRREAAADDEDPADVDWSWAEDLVEDPESTR